MQRQDKSLALPDYTRATELHTRTHTRFLAHPDAPEWVSKLFTPRSRPRDVLRKYLHSEGARAYRSARILRLLGLETPAVPAYAVAYAPWARYESLALMQRLGEHQQLQALLRSAADDALRSRLLEQSAAEFGLLYGRGYCHRDPHLGNIVVDEQDRLVWIDADIRRPRKVSLLREDYAKARRVLETKMQRHAGAAAWDAFSARLEAELRRQPYGPALLG